jgi:translation initiation factor 2B subunit (eIF-2B alpha/beta/delta family)
VEVALRSSAPKVIVAESEPGGEGARVARTLTGAGLEVVVITDSAIASALEAFNVDLVMVGADAVAPSGAILNKVGTRLAALAARDAGIPFHAVASRDKVQAGEGGALVTGNLSAASEYRPVFEWTPPHLVSGVVMENGIRSPGEITSVARELAALERWRYRGAQLTDELSSPMRNDP